MALPIDQLSPLERNPKTGEVFLRLAPPHQHIILTPPRESDKEALLTHLNDERVYKWLSGPPFPYTMKDADYWIGIVKRKTDAVLNDLLNASNGQGASLIYIDGCPVRMIREVAEDGSDTFIGDIGISRCAEFRHLRDQHAQKVLEEQNENRPVGDPEIIWDFGDFLIPSYHGQGVMTAAMKTVIERWAIPRMNVHIIQGALFKGNIGSLRVFEKNGFKMFDTVEDCAEIAESKGGGKVGFHFMKWSRT